MISLERVVASDRCCSCGTAGAILCRGCLGSMRPPADPCTTRGSLRILSPLAYDGAARTLVLALKLRAQRAAAPPLVEAMVTLVQREGLHAEAVTWVPGRRKDVRRRGFDHAHLLAQGVAGRLGLPLASLLRRVGTTDDQAGLSRAERWSNVRRAFTASPGAERVVVVDDLMTTGATAEAAFHALTEAGARTVEILAACKAADPS